MNLQCKGEIKGVNHGRVIALMIVITGIGEREWGGHQGERRPNAQLRSHSTYELQLIFFGLACACEDLRIVVESE